MPICFAKDRLCGAAAKESQRLIVPEAEPRLGAFAKRRVAFFQNRALHVPGAAFQRAGIYGIVRVTGKVAGSL
jgi:hypothetical protein